MALRYQMPLAEMVTQVPPDESSIAIRDGDGNNVGTVAWSPDKPGDVAFRNASVTVSFIFFGIGVMLVVGLGALRRAMMAERAQD